MNPIRTNKPVFFGDDGEVLKSGNIYIGQPDQWPLSSPKTVTLQDSAGSQFEASQPLKTNNQGRIEYNGKSVMALVDGDYSILVRDRNGVTVGEGYTPFVENPEEGEDDAGGVTHVRLLLEDVKTLDVGPGQTVRSVGRLLATDGLGADWLVVSATGSPADDINIIDFDNGLQGRRINNFLYREELQSEAEGEGASLIMTESGEDVETALATTLTSANQYADDIATGESGSTRVVLGAIEEPWRSIIQASGSVSVFVVPTTETVWVDSINRETWFNPPVPGGGRVGKCFSVHNPGAATIYVNVRIQIDQDDLDDGRVRIQKNGVTEEQINSVSTTMTFEKIAVDPEEFAYFDVQAFLTSGSGNDTIYLDNFHVWLTD